MSLDIEVVWMGGADTFISGVWGSCTTEVLDDIERDLRLNEAGWNYSECSTLKVKCDYSPGWDDYGPAYGEVLHWPGYWELSVLSCSTPEEMGKQADSTQQAAAVNGEAPLPAGA
jgi:hypothetical protein